MTKLAIVEELKSLLRPSSHRRKALPDANVDLEILIDDELDLPARLPGDIKHKGSKSKSTFRKQR